MKTENGRRKTEVRKQKTEDGRRKTEDGRRKTEDGRLTPEKGRQSFAPSAGYCNATKGPCLRLLRNLKRKAESC
jgi:hypothetical protein